MNHDFNQKKWILKICSNIENIVMSNENYNKIDDSQVKS